MTVQNGFADAADFGFSPEANGMDNAEALQRAVDGGGTIAVCRPGTYKMARTVYLGSNTSVQFGAGVVLQKVDENGSFVHVLANKGALTKTWDRNIVVSGLEVQVNGVDCLDCEVYGLQGQLAFFYVKDLCIERFRCFDLESAQFAVQVCTFEDLIVEDVIIKGRKDGIHLGPGKRFTIRNGVFQTFDDAIALNAHDYASSNPELGWIENGVVENCYDLDADDTTGFFCRILAGAWIDWQQGMEVQNSDTVVSNGRLYRVQAKPDGAVYASTTQPDHESGSKVLDGINWGVVQENVCYTAGVRNVSFRDIFLEKPRIAFSVHFDNDRYSRSYYPGAPIPMQKGLCFDNVQIQHDETVDLFAINTPVDGLTISRSRLRNNRICFHGRTALADHDKTQISMSACTFEYKGSMTLIKNEIDRKEIVLKTNASLELSNDFRASIEGGGLALIDSDLTGLR